MSENLQNHITKLTKTINSLSATVSTCKQIIGELQGQVIDLRSNTYLIEHEKSVLRNQLTQLASKNVEPNLMVTLECANNDAERSRRVIRAMDKEIARLMAIINNLAPKNPPEGNPEFLEVVPEIEEIAKGGCLPVEPKVLDDCEGTDAA